MAQVTINEIVESYMNDYKASFKDLPVERKRALYSELHKKVKSIIQRKSVESIPKMMDKYKTVFLKENETNMFLNLANRKTQSEKENEFKAITNKNGYNCEFPDLEYENINLRDLSNRLKSFSDPTSKRYVEIPEYNLDETIEGLLQLYNDVRITQNRFKIIKQAVVDDPLKASQLIDKYIALAGEDPTLDVFELARRVNNGHEYKEVIAEVQNEMKRLTVLNKNVPVVKDPDLPDNGLGFDSSFVGDSFEYSMTYNDYDSFLSNDSKKSSTPNAKGVDPNPVATLDEDEPDKPTDPTPTNPPREKAKELPKKKEVDWVFGNANMNEDVIDEPTEGNTYNGKDDVRKENPKRSTTWEFGKRVEDEKKPYDDIMVDIKANDGKDFLFDSNELNGSHKINPKKIVIDMTNENNSKLTNEQLEELIKKGKDEPTPNTAELLEELVKKTKDEPKPNTAELLKETIEKTKQAENDLFGFVNDFEAPKYEGKVPSSKGKISNLKEDAYKFYEKYRNKEGNVEESDNNKTVSDRTYEDIKRVLRNTVKIYRNTIDLLYALSPEKLEKSGRQISKDAEGVLGEIEKDLGTIATKSISAVEKALKDDDRKLIESLYNSKNYISDPFDEKQEKVNYFKFMTGKMGDVAQKLKEKGVDIYNVFNSTNVVDNPDIPGDVQGYVGTNYRNSMNYKNALSAFTEQKTDEKLDEKGANGGESAKKGGNGDKKPTTNSNSDGFVRSNPELGKVAAANTEFEESQKGVIGNANKGQKGKRGSKVHNGNANKSTGEANTRSANASATNNAGATNGAGVSTGKKKKKDNVFKRIGKWMARKPVLTATLLFAVAVLPVTGALSTTILPSVFLFGTVGLLASNGVKGIAKGVSPRYHRFIYDYDIDKKNKKLEVVQEKMAMGVKKAQKVLNTRDAKEKRTYVELPQNSNNEAEYALGYYANKKNQLKKTTSRRLAERSIKKSEKAERKLANIDYNLTAVEAKQINEIVKLGKKEEKMKKAIGKKYDKMMNVRGSDGATYRANAERKEAMENSTALNEEQRELKTVIDDIGKVKHFDKKIKSQEKKDIKTESRIEKILEESLSDESSRREAMDYVVKDMIANNGKVNPALMHIVSKKVGRVGVQYINTKYEESQMGDGDTSGSDTIFKDVKGESTIQDSNTARAETRGRYAYRKGVSIDELEKIADPKLRETAKNAYNNEKAKDNERLL